MKRWHKTRECHFGLILIDPELKRLVGWNEHRTEVSGACRPEERREADKENSQWCGGDGWVVVGGGADVGGVGECQRWWGPRAWRWWWGGNMVRIIGGSDCDGRTSFWCDQSDGDAGSNVRPRAVMRTRSNESVCKRAAVGCAMRLESWNCWLYLFGRRGCLYKMHCMRQSTLLITASSLYSSKF